MERVLSKYKRLWLKLNLKKLLRDRHVDVHAFTEGKVNTLMEKCVAATRKLALQLHHSMGHDPPLHSQGTHYIRAGAFAGEGMTWE